METLYKLVEWPESQLLMDHPRFNECLFVENIEGHDYVESSSYMCPVDIFEEIFKNNNIEEIKHSAELMDNISFVPNSVNEEELVNTAKDILVKECNLTEKQADAMANMSVILEKNKYGNKD